MVDTTIQIETDPRIDFTSLPVIESAVLKNQPDSPLQSRISALRKLNPSALAAFTPQTLTALAQFTDPKSKTDHLLKQFDLDKLQVLEQLVLILQHPDITDAAFRLGFAEKDDSLVVKELQRWLASQELNLTHPHHPLPESIRDQEDQHRYLRAVGLIRPGLDLEIDRLRENTRRSEIYQFALKSTKITPTEEILDDWVFYTNRLPLSEMTTQAETAIVTGASLALELSKDSPELRNTVVGAITQAIESQDKWSVISEDGIDKVSYELIKLLVGVHAADKSIPEAIPILLDTLYRRVVQDDVHFLSMFDPTDDFTLHFQTHFKQVLNNLIDMALKSDLKAVESYLGSHLRDAGVKAILTDLIISRPELHYQNISLGSNREFEYFGKKFIFADLPAKESIQLQELTFGVFVATNAAGEYLGMYTPDPSRYPYSLEVVELKQVDPADLFYWSDKQKQPITPERLRQFVSAFPALKSDVAKSLPAGLSPAVFPLASYFQLWSYLEALPAQERTLLEKFREEFGSLAIISFLTGEYDQKNIARVARFALETQSPRSYLDEDEIQHVRIYESFSERILRKYASLSLDAWMFAVHITKVPEFAVQIRDLILARAKAMLLAGVHFHENNQQLTPLDQLYLETAFDAHHLFLTTMSDKSGAVARSLRLSYDSVRDFFRYHDPADPDSRALFQSTMELWSKIYLDKQELAPYSGQTEALASRFYQEYQTFEAEADFTTADTVLEKTRYLQSIHNDLEAGLLPREADQAYPAVIGYLGIGNGRMEKIITEFVSSHTKGYRFIGIDINRPQSLPPDIEFQRMNMKDLGNFMPGKFDRLMLIWSPFMDVIELDEMLDTVESLALAVKDNATIELDIHFPFGEHSYERVLKEFSASHPDEPFGMMYKKFERSSLPPVGKLFFASDPAFISWIFGLYGFEITNLPSDPREIERLCKQASEDDSFIPQGPQDNPDLQAVYRTASGLNRITFKLRRKKGGSFEPESILAIRSKIKAQ